MAKGTKKETEEGGGTFLSLLKQVTVEHFDEMVSKSGLTRAEQLVITSEFRRMKEGA